MSLPAAVLWDMDGTLVDTEPYWIAAEHDIVEEHGGTWSDEFAHQLDMLDWIIDGTPPIEDDDARRMLLLHRQGASLHTIAAALNAEGRRTPDGRRWTTTTVARVVASLVRSRA